MRQQYTADVKRDGQVWLIYVPEVDRRTQVRNEIEIRPMARLLIALTLEVEPDSFDLTIIKAFSRG